MSFNSNENKGLLWSLMYEGGVFTNIPQDNLSKVKELFENKINILNKESGTILEKNKRAMMEMVKDLESLRNAPTLTGNNVKERKYDIPVTASDIQNQRREIFNSNLEKRQNEFTDMMTVKKPSKPKFSDKTEDTPIGSEMDKLLADMIAKRDLQLTNATNGQNTAAAQEWITKDNDNPGNFSNTLNDNIPPTLKIGEKVEELVPNVENIKIAVKEEIKKKHVSFEDDSDNDDFFKRFKKSERANSDIINEIKTLKSEINDRLRKLDELLYELH